MECRSDGRNCHCLYRANIDEREVDRQGERERDIPERQRHEASQRHHVRASSKARHPGSGCATTTETHMYISGKKELERYREREREKKKRDREREREEESVRERGSKCEREREKRARE